VSTIRRRRPRVQFAQIPNAVLRDYRLSWRARGLLAELLSYPPDYLISVDELVKRARQASGATEGREAMRAAVRELKAVGYIVSTKRQDARGRWFTEVEVTDDPAYDMPNPPLDGVAVSPAPDSPTPDAGVSAGRTDDGFPGVGEPGVGAPGVIKNTDTNTVLPPTPSSTRASADDPARQEEEEEETTNSPIGGTSSPLTDGLGGTESPIGGTESPIGGTDSPLLSSDLNPSSSGADRSQAADSTSHGTRRTSPPEALIVAECGATPEEAAALVDHIRRQGEAKRSLAGYVRHLVANGDMAERLRSLRAARTVPTSRHPADERRCGLHGTPMPGGTCSSCAGDIKAGDAADVVDYYLSLTHEERDTRADLKHLLESRGLIESEGVAA